MIARDREIDAAGDHDEGLAGGDEADHRGKLDQVAEVAEGAEAVADEAGDDPDRRDHGKGQERPAAQDRRRRAALAEPVALISPQPPRVAAAPRRR